MSAVRKTLWRCCNCSAKVVSGRLPIGCTACGFSTFQSEMAVRVIDYDPDEVAGYMDTITGLRKAQSELKSKLAEKDGEVERWKRRAERLAETELKLSVVRELAATRFDEIKRLQVELAKKDEAIAITRDEYQRFRKLYASECERANELAAKLEERTEERDRFHRMYEQEYERCRPPGERAPKPGWTQGGETKTPADWPGMFEALAGSVAPVQDGLLIAYQRVRR